MNKIKRNNIASAINKMNSAIVILDDVLDKESFAMENYPENLQGTDIYYDMESAVDTLQSVIDDVNDSIESLESLI